MITSITLHAADSTSEKWKSCYRGARQPAIVVNYNDVIITTQSGTPLKADQVKKAITKAAVDKNGKVTHSGEEKLLASLTVRGKHNVTTEIFYSPEKYSIRYKDSSNMNYAMCEGEAFIHPNYNEWVSNLNNAIQAKLAQI